MAYVPSDASAAISDPDYLKGANIQSTYPTEFSSEPFKKSLRQLRATGATHVSLVVPVHQPNQKFSYVSDGKGTPTDAALIEGIRYANSLGLKVVLKIHVVSDDGWAAYVIPDNRQLWFASYKAKLLHFSKIAQETGGVPLIILGTELINLSVHSLHPANTPSWVDIITSVRQVYKGKLTYQANFGGYDFALEVPKIAFWPYLDYVSISAYYNVPADASKSVESMRNSWKAVDDAVIRTYYNTWGKPVMFGEVGFRSMQGANMTPYDYYTQKPTDNVIQANAYDATISYWSDKPHFAGVLFWDWLGNADLAPANNNWFTPQGKPAEEVMRKWYGGGGSNPPASATTTPYAMSVGGIPTDPKEKQALNFSLTVENKGASVGNAVVNVEVYNQSNQRVYQKAFEGQNLNQNQPSSYQLSWTPESTGQYKVKAGVFASGWSSLLFWNDAVATIMVVATSTAPVDPLATTAKLTVAGAKDFTSIPGQAILYEWSSANAVSPISAVRASTTIMGDPNRCGFTTYQSWIANSLKGAYVYAAIPQQENCDYHLVYIVRDPRTGAYVSDTAIHRVRRTLPPPPVNPPVATTTPATTTPPVTPPATTTPAAIQMWWPTDGTQLSGVQPVKAVVQGRDISTYKMYWQVGDGQLVEMYDTQVDGPHKEQYIDFTNWNWNSSGQYALKFTAKDASTGATISTKTINIKVASSSNPPVVSPPTGTSTPATTTPPMTPPVTPPAQQAAIETWWPTEGARLGGLQPIKAILQGRDISTYKMYWQLGDGQLVEMYDTHVDGPHKEQYIDFTNWNWDESGRYVLTLVAKDPSTGETISTRTVTVYVNR